MFLLWCFYCGVSTGDCELLQYEEFSVTDGGGADGGWHVAGTIKGDLYCWLSVSNCVSQYRIVLNDKHKTMTHGEQQGQDTSAAHIRGMFLYSVKMRNIARYSSHFG